MPKQTFNPEEWLNKVKEKVMAAPWGTAIMWNNGTLFVEVVRAGEGEELFLRVRTANMRNAIKLTRKEHLEAFLELADAIRNNEKNLSDKLQALKEVLKAGRSQVEEV